MQKMPAGVIAFTSVTEMLRSFALLVVLAFVGVRLKRFGMLSEKGFTVFSYAAVALSLWFRLHSLRGFAFLT